MNVNHPHEVKSTEEVRQKLRDAGVPVGGPARARDWIPLTEHEARVVANFTPAQRGAWLARMPLHERLRRIEAAEAEFGA